MKLKLVFIILILIVILAFTITNIKDSEIVISQEQQEIISEKSFYKLSDINTSVFQLTNNQGNDSIYYQEPSYFSKDGSKFLFRSDRDGKYKMYISNIEKGQVIQVYDRDWGWAPTWSHDGKEIYVGSMGEIQAINAETLKKRQINIPTKNLPEFLHLSPDGKTILFGESFFGEHKQLSIANITGQDYKVLYTLDHKKEFYIDHPLWINNNTIMFLTRGLNRNFTLEFNQPYIMHLNGTIYRLPLECSHYDVSNERILCGQEGYILNIKGKIIKEIPDIHGHGVWASDGNTFLMTGDPIPVPSGPYYGKIMIFNFSSNYSYSIVSHESTYDSTITHIQPNAQFSPDGKYVIYESDLKMKDNSDLFLVELK